MIQVGAEVYEVISPSFDEHHHHHHRDFDFRITIAIFLLIIIISLNIFMIIVVFFKILHDIYLCHAFLANELMVGVESP